MVLRCFTVALAVLFLPLKESVGGNIKGTVKILGGKGVEHAVIYIEKVEGEVFPPPEKNAVVDQVKMTFVPHVLPILEGTTVDFPNNDSTRHNVFSPSKAKKFNLGTYPAGVTKQVAFEKTGVVALLCNVHPEMSAFLVVLQNPYYAMPEKGGKYTIADVPPGKYMLVVWHPKFKSKQLAVEVPQEGSISADFFLDE